MTKTFNKTVLFILAYKQGQAFSEAANKDNTLAYGSMNVADAMGFERDTAEWRGAMCGAMQHIDQNGPWY